MHISDSILCFLQSPCSGCFFWLKGWEFLLPHYKVNIIWSTQTTVDTQKSLLVTLLYTDCCVLFILQMACCESTDKSSLESDCCGAEFSPCAVAMMERERESYGVIGSPVQILCDEETQGYDVEFDPPLESKYECPICLMALRSAVQTPCGHRFCRCCIQKSIRYVCWSLRMHYGLCTWQT